MITVKRTVNLERKREKKIQRENVDNDASLTQ